MEPLNANHYLGHILRKLNPGDEGFRKILIKLQKTVCCTFKGYLYGSNPLCSGCVTMGPMIMQNTPIAEHYTLPPGLRGIITCAICHIPVSEIRTGIYCIECIIREWEYNIRTPLPVQNTDADYIFFHPIWRDVMGLNPGITEFKEETTPQENTTNPWLENVEEIIKQLEDEPNTHETITEKETEKNSDTSPSYTIAMETFTPNHFLGYLLRTLKLSDDDIRKTLTKLSKSVCCTIEGYENRLEMICIKCSPSLDVDYRVSYVTTHHPLPAGLRGIIPCAMCHIPVSKLKKSIECIQCIISEVESNSRITPNVLHSDAEYLCKQPVWQKFVRNLEFGRDTLYSDSSSDEESLEEITKYLEEEGSRSSGPVSSE